VKYDLTGQAKRKKRLKKKKKEKKSARKKRQELGESHFFYRSGLRSVEKPIVQIGQEASQNDDVAHGAFNRPPTDTQLMNDWRPHTTTADDR
jgi:hypothetical protein